MIGLRCVQQQARLAARPGICRLDVQNGRLHRLHNQKSWVDGGRKRSFFTSPDRKRRIEVRAEPTLLDRKPNQEAQLQDLLKYLAITIGVAVASAAAFLYIDQFSTTPCTVDHTCTPIDTGLKVALVATHLYSFMLIPATMFVFYAKITELRGAGARSPFTALLGLAYVMVAIASEIGWHVTQDWYYKEEYAVLNLGFYEFLVLGLSMWAYGIRVDPHMDHPYSTKDITAEDLRTNNLQLPLGLHDTQWGAATDLFLTVSPVLTGILYLLGAEVLHTKVPIYMLMLAVFVVLTDRFWKLLKTRWVLLFPFFSVGVNLGFIALLNTYEADPVKNPLFHICHDLFGTELGIGVIAALTYLGLSASDSNGQPANFTPELFASSPSHNAWVSETWPGPTRKDMSTRDVNVQLLKAKERRLGVLLFLHGFQQIPQNYDSILGALAGGGLDVVCPLAPPINNSPKLLQEAIRDNMEAVIKHMGTGDGTHPYYKLSGQVIAIGGHSLGGGLSLLSLPTKKPETLQPPPFTHIALLSPYPKLEVGNPFDDMPTPLSPLKALVLSAQLDILARASPIQKNIVVPLQDCKAEVETYNFPWGNHTGYCDFATFFGVTFPQILIVLQGDTAVTTTPAWLEQLQRWLSQIKLPPAPFKFTAIILLLGSVATYLYVESGDLSTGWDIFLRVLSLGLAGIMALQLFWVLYYAPYVQGPKTKDLVVNFLLPKASAPPGSTAP